MSVWETSAPCFSSPNREVRHSPLFRKRSTVNSQESAVSGCRLGLLVSAGVIRRRESSGYDLRAGQGCTGTIGVMPTVLEQFADGREACTPANRAAQHQDVGSLTGQRSPWERMRTRFCPGRPNSFPDVVASLRCFPLFLASTQHQFPGGRELPCVLHVDRLGRGSAPGVCVQRAGIAGQPVSRAKACIDLTWSCRCRCENQN